MKNIWDERFMQMAEFVSNWSDCIREERKIGAVVASGKNLISIGFNSAPEGIKTCAERGECIRKQFQIESGTRQEICYTLCAEQNAIFDAVKSGRDLSNATIYITHTPCAICARWIIKSGIKRIVYHAEYTDKFSLQLLTEAGIKLDKIQRKILILK